MAKVKSNVRYEVIDINALKSGDYQRNINVAHTQKIVRNFNKREFDPIVVSDRDGDLRLIDGQHRVSACKAIGIKSVMARIISGLSEEEEAKLFLDLSGTKGQIKRLTPQDIFNAKIIAKDPTALSVKEIVESNGFKFGSKSGEVAAYNLLTKLHERHGALILDRTMRIIRESFPDKNMQTHNVIIEGVTEFIATYGNNPAYSDVALISALSKTTASEIVKLVRFDATSRIAKIKELNAILNIFNYNKKKNIIDNIHFNMR